MVSPAKEYYVGIDVGIHHLALCWCIAGDEVEIVDFELVNIAKFSHKRVPRKECLLPHSAALCDRVNHVIQEFMPVFDAAKQIFIEQQPPLGLIGVEQLLYDRFRTKATLVSPRSLQAFLWPREKVSYEDRKKRIELLSQQYLTAAGKLKMQNLNRKHDCADSIMILVYGLKKYNESRHSLAMRAKPQTHYPADFFEQFRYLGP